MLKIANLARNVMTSLASGFFPIALTVLGLAAVPAASAELSQLKAMFQPNALVGEPKIVDCKLSGGTQTKCYAFTVQGTPSNHAMGPWCPTNIKDGKEAGGIWLEKGKVYDVTGAFVENLAKFYNDPTWQLFDPETGKIKVTDTKEGCLAAARPDVDPAYKNYCVQCQVAYLETSTVQTYIVPIKPVDRFFARGIGMQGVGVALNGVRIDGPAPVDAILGAYTLAPFDGCGGHVNPHVGYHYHAPSDCLVTSPSVAGHAAIIGIAMDGYMLHAQHDADGKEPSDLDRCRGHSVEGIGYHYHINGPGENALLGCFAGEVGCSDTGSETTCDATQSPKRP